MGIVASNNLLFSQHLKAVDAYSKSGKVSPDALSKLWGIGPKSARKTVESTTQSHVRKLNGKIHRRVRTKVHQRRYRQLGGPLARFSSDTFQASCTSLRGNDYFQLFTNRGNFTKTYSMESKSDAPLALNRFIHEVGVPTEIHTDGSKEQSYAKWKKICNKHQIYRTWTEPYSPWQNLAERAGGIVKCRTRDMMRRTNTPIVLWDYCIEYNAELRCLTAADNIELDGRTPFEKVMGYTPDISELVEFQWYQ